MLTTRRSFLSASLAALGLSPALLQASGGRREYAVDVTLNQKYHPTGFRHTLDVFTPRGAGKTPVVLFAHGGTWMFGDKNFFGLYRAVGRFLAKNGYTAVLPNYRLSPFVKHPEHAKDLARAYAWTWRNVARLGGDPERMVLAGHSAGGHLVSLLATDPRYLKAEELKLDDRARQAIKGVLGVCGVYRVPGKDDFRGMVKTMADYYVGDNCLNPTARKLGELVNPFPHIFGSDPAGHEAASPLTHVRKGLPPFLLLHAVMEVPGLIDQASDFEKALRKEGNQAEVKCIDKCSHRTILFNLHKPTDEAGPALLAFLDRHTAPAARS